MILSDLGTDALKGIVNDSRRRPLPPTAADIMYEALDDLPAFWGMRNLGMKLQTVERLAAVPDGDVGTDFKPVFLI